MEFKLKETPAVQIVRHEGDGARYLANDTPEIVRCLSDGDIVLGMRDGEGNPIEMRLPSSLVALIAYMKMDRREYAGKTQLYESNWP